VGPGQREAYDARQLKWDQERDTVVEGVPAAQQVSGGGTKHIHLEHAYPLTGRGKGQERKWVLRDTNKAEGKIEGFITGQTDLERERDRERDRCASTRARCEG